MNNLKSRFPTPSSYDLPNMWRRLEDGLLQSPGGQRWRQVRRRELTHLTHDDWASGTVLLRRPSRGWLPCSREGRAVQNLLLDFGPTETASLLLMLPWWDNEEDVKGFLIRALRDRSAHLMTLLPVGAR